MPEKNVTVIGVLAENGCCPTEKHLSLPNAIRGLVYHEIGNPDVLFHCFLGNAEMDLAMANYYLLPDGRDIAVYTSKKDMQAKADRNHVPPHVFTARVFGKDKNPLLDLPFYCLKCKDGHIDICKKAANI